MLINQQNLRAMFDGFSTAFNEGFEGATTHLESVAMRAPSQAEREQYGWLGQMPRMREWLGDRHIWKLQAHDYTIKNREFEQTIEVQRTTIEDDQYGVLAPLFRDMGRMSAEHPDELVFELIGRAFEDTGYDGRPFFDDEHPVLDENGAATTVSNMQDGAGPAWFLLDTTRAIKPFIFQERVAYQFDRLDSPTDENVFMRGQFIYGVRARAAAGFGLWQLAFGSKADLTAENYKSAREAMRSLKGDYGRRLGIRPSLLLVPPALEEEARQLLVAATGDAGASNVWANSAELIVAEWLA